MRGILTWGPAAIWAAVLFFLSGSSDTPDTSWLPFGDKLGHMVLYAVLGAALAWGRWASSSRLPHSMFILTGVLYGVIDEWHQSFVPGRESSVADVVADALGLAIGYGGSILASAAHRKRKALNERHPNP